MMMTKTGVAAFALILATAVGCDKSEGEAEESSTDEAAQEEEESQAIELECSTKAQTLSGDEGSTHEVTCPADCGSNSVWGNRVYSDDSSICTAAVHSGALSLEGGSTVVRIEAGQESYPAISQNGVNSRSWGSWGRSFTFEGLPEVDENAPQTIACNTAAEDVEGDEGDEVTVICPADCGSSTAWGTDIYSDDSSVCSAAIHAGVIETSGGTVVVTIVAGQESYEASERNGISSSSWGSWSRSFSVAQAD